MASEPAESLADFVRRIRNEKDYSLTDVQKRSGGRITNGYVSRIENGFVVNPSTAKLQALAKGLGVSEDELFAIVRGGTPLTEEEFLESKFGDVYTKYKEMDAAGQLSEIDRQLTESYLDSILHHLGKKRRRA